MKVRDSQRQKLYDAERLAFDNTPAIPYTMIRYESVDDCEKAIRLIWSKTRFQNEFPAGETRPITILLDLPEAATGATSIVVSHDVAECFAICDYAYIISAGRIIGFGTPDELRASDDAEIRQFIGGLPDGPVKFHYPARDYAQDMGLSS